MLNGSGIAMGEREDGGGSNTFGGAAASWSDEKVVAPSSAVNENCVR